MGVAKWELSQLDDGLVGLWGQVEREWAPAQKVHTCNMVQGDMLQPWSLKLLQTILEPTKTRRRPRRSLDWEEAGKLVGVWDLDRVGRGTTADMRG